MARTAKPAKGPRLTDLIGLDVLPQYIPFKKVDEALEASGRQSQRQRQLPARVMVYYVLALALFMEVGYGEVLRCLVEGSGAVGPSRPASTPERPFGHLSGPPAAVP